MVSEVFSLIFSHWLLATLISVGGGLYAGYGTRSNGWRTVWVVLFAFISLVAVGRTDAYQAVARANRVGLLSGSDFDTFIVTAIGFYWGAFLLAIFIGACVQSAKDEELRDAAQNLTTEEIHKMIEHTVSHPHIATIPWVASTWYAMSDQDQTNWVRRNIREIRDVIAHYGGPDLINVNEFIVELQQIERR